MAECGLRPIPTLQLFHEMDAAETEKERATVEGPTIAIRPCTDKHLQRLTIPYSGFLL